MILKGESEVKDRQNTMAKRKRTKDKQCLQDMIIQKRKLKTKQHTPPIKNS